MGVVSRLDGAECPLPRLFLCDLWLLNDQRLGGDAVGVDPDTILGRWPQELETDAIVRLAQVVADRSWEIYAQTPAVAQKLAERARPMPLDVEIGRRLQHLQHVCYRPRLHLRIEEERLPVSRARRTPVRAIADLVSHPGDWEHRLLRSVQPARVLACQSEDEWNLYENRVAVRLVDHLLEYVARRIEELRRIKEILAASRDHSDEVRHTSFRRARRITQLWSNTLESKTEADLHQTIHLLERAERDLQALMDSPLYQRIPRRQAVPLVLKPTNILVNDAHYRKVAALWRTWLKFGYRRNETIEQRTQRRQHEALAWDQFVLHLVARAFDALGWSCAQPAHDGAWALSKPGWLNVNVDVDDHGVVRLTAESAASPESRPGAAAGGAVHGSPGAHEKTKPWSSSSTHRKGRKSNGGPSAVAPKGRTLRLVPICADLSHADPTKVTETSAAMDSNGGHIVLAHVGSPAPLPDADRASGWSLGGKTVLFACSPWGIDSEERMARLLHGWLARYAAPPYPASAALHALPEWAGEWEWVCRTVNHIVAVRAPTSDEKQQATQWRASTDRQLEADERRAKTAKQGFDPAPRNALVEFSTFLERATDQLSGLGSCPVCNGKGQVEPRRGRAEDGSDWTWWATCGECESEWGTRACGQCKSRYRALAPSVGLGAEAAVAAAHACDWPDRVYGRDLWAQPCAKRPNDHFRCPECGQCPNASCDRCRNAVQRGVSF